MDRTLPPGSTSAELQAEINIADSGDTIIITSDMPFSQAVTIPTGKEITIKSDVNDPWTMTSPDTANTRHFIVKGSLILQKIILDGGETGGGVNPQNGSLTMNNGCVIQNCFSSTSGGGVYVFFGSLTMNSGSKITNCSASYPTNNVDGGGVYLINSKLDMYFGSTILFCTANGSGGGIYVSGTGEYNLTSATINGNHADRYGGGIATGNDVVLNLNGTTLSGNSATIGGGGIYVTARSSIKLTGYSFLVTNSAKDGGGIYTMDTSNISSEAFTAYTDNVASVAYAPPADAKTMYPNILFRMTSVTDHPLNNFDINNTSTEPLVFEVTYNANGGTGAYSSTGMPFHSMYTILSLDATGISRSGYAFIGWNTEPDGGGTPYLPGETMTIRDNATLYAQWVSEPSDFTVTYNANGGTGSFEDTGRQFGDNYMILSPNQTHINRPGYTFTGWNTQPDGSGTALAPGEIIQISGDVRLYAQWRLNDTPTPPRICRKPVTKCRMAIEGRKIWDDNDNLGGKRPNSVEILLMRDGKIHDRRVVTAADGWAYGFCCLPVWKSTGVNYLYKIDETDVAGYTKRTDGYNVINTLIP